MQKPKTDFARDTVGWGNVDWQKVNLRVYKLQKRIFDASRLGDVKRVRKLLSYVDEVLV